MRGLILLFLLLSIAGYGNGEPSTAEVKRGFMRNVGVNSRNADIYVRRIGNGRWAIYMTAEKGGVRRSLNATAVMDKNGDIHYYTD